MFSWLETEVYVKILFNSEYPGEICLHLERIRRLLVYFVTIYLATEWEESSYMHENHILFSCPGWIMSVVSVVAGNFWS